MFTQITNETFRWRMNKNTYKKFYIGTNTQKRQDKDQLDRPIVICYQN